MSSTRNRLGRHNVDDRYWLTPKGEVAVAAIRANGGQPIVSPLIDQSAHPEHHITVTGGGPFGRAWFECTCGIERRFASKPAANDAALAHHRDLIQETTP